MSTALSLGRRIGAMDDDAVRLTKRAINGCFDAQGLRDALKNNLEIAVEIESIETSSCKKFKEITEAYGVLINPEKTKFGRGGRMSKRNPQIGI